ncbi:hypothetical protein [Undibacterium aquatile]|uniref:Uncharacterized protein n=1 Tax=Undibacterium aquatile TaxID=1537398 RepID=A0ABR6XI46_9BURK|nr:hypothetical protein [Undibacterium aquatile]MBC3812572.1 hypothetical protein [Undibacterium aquatile]
MSFQLPVSPQSVIQNNAFHPNWGNEATQLYEVVITQGFYFKGTTAPQKVFTKTGGYVLPGGNTQISKSVIDRTAPWAKGWILFL